jgi:hypothetical protein
MAVVLMDRVDLGPGAGGYQFRIEKATSHDHEIYEEGKRLQEMVRQQAQPQEKESQDEGQE